MVRCFRQEESESGPKTGEGSCGKEADQTGLEENRILENKLDNGPQDFTVVDISVGGRVIRHEEPQEDDDEVLQPKREPVYIAPGRILSDYTGEYPCNKKP